VSSEIRMVSILASHISILKNNKLKKVKKIAFITLWSVLAIGLLVSMGFVNKEQDALHCKSLDIKVNQDDDLYFLNKMDIAQLIYKRGDSIVGQPKSSVNIPAIKNALNSHSDIANAEVYITIDGRLKVEVKQRKPVLRVFNVNGDSYYMDDEGELMPLSDKYTAKVLVANGNISETYAKNYTYSMDDIAKDKAKKKVYYRHTGYMGHLKQEKYHEVFAKDPTEVLRRAVFNMLPKNFIRQKRMNRLKIEA